MTDQQTLLAQTALVCFPSRSVLNHTLLMTNVLRGNDVSNPYEIIGLRRLCFAETQLSLIFVYCKILKSEQILNFFRSDRSVLQIY